MQRTLDKVIEDMRLCKQNGIETEARVLFSTKKKIEDDINMTQQKIQTHELLIEKTNNTKIIVYDKINNLEKQLSELKTKEELGKLTNECVELLESIEDEDIPMDDLTHKINSEFNASDIRLEEYSKNETSQTTELDKIKNDEEFNKFMDEL